MRWFYSLSYLATSNVKRARQKASALVPPNSKAHKRLVSSSFSLTPPSASKHFQKKKVPPALPSARKRNPTMELVLRKKNVASAVVNGNNQALTIDTDEEQVSCEASINEILDNKAMWLWVCVYSINIIMYASRYYMYMCAWFVYDSELL